MDIPSRVSVETLCKSIELVMDANMRGTEHPDCILLAQCATVFAYYTWHRRALPGEPPLACIRSMISSVDTARAIELLHTHGIKGLACVNATIWAQLPSNAVHLPPMRMCRQACRCCGRPCDASGFSPFLWRTCSIETPLCRECFSWPELHVPLYPQPSPKWCTACGHGEKTLRAVGHGCFMCDECFLSIKRDG